MCSAFLDRLKSDTPVLCAEGYIFEAEKRGYVSSGEFVPKFILEYPEDLKTLYRDFVRSGSDIIVAFTYNMHREKARVAGVENKVEEVNKQAVRMAHEVAAEFNYKTADGKRILIAGNMSNTNIWETGNKEVQEQAKNILQEVADWSNEVGVDLIIGETFYYAGEALAAAEAAQKVGLPSVITLAVPGREKLLDDFTPVEACRDLKRAGVDVVGLNCFRGPETFRPIIKEIREEIEGPIAALPVPYRTTPNHNTFFRLPTIGDSKDSPSAFPDALDPHYVDRYEMANELKSYFDMGIEYLGICCGNFPAMFRLLAKKMGRKTYSDEYLTNIENHFLLGQTRVRDSIKQARPEF